MRNIIWSTIIIIATFIIGLLSRGKEVELVNVVEYRYDTIIEVKTIDVPAIPDTVIKVEWDTLVVANDEYKYLYYSLMDSLNSINKYQVILKDDSLAFIGIDADVFANTLSKIKYTYQNRTPTQINYNMNIVNEGDGLYVQGITNFNSISANFTLQNNNILYSVGYDTKGRVNIGLGYKVK